MVGPHLRRSEDLRDLEGAFIKSQSDKYSGASPVIKKTIKRGQKKNQTDNQSTDSTDQLRRRMSCSLL